MKGQEWLQERARRAWPHAVVLFCLICGSVAAANTPWSWLGADPVPQARMTPTLNALWAMTPTEAAQAAKSLGTIADGAAGDTRRAARLLQAVALERADAIGSARAAYGQVAEGQQSSAYAATADLRLRLLNAANADEQEAVYQSIVDDPRFLAAPEKRTWGWILDGDHWSDGLRPAALRALVALRSDWLSVRLFDYLKSVSPLPPSYGYLFVLLAVSLGVKILQLPWIVKAARSAQVLRSLKGEIAYMQDLPPDSRGPAMMQLMQANGVDMKAGCLLPVLDVIFLFWIFYAVASFAPQMALDGAGFYGVPDVTRYNDNIVIAFIWITLIRVLRSRPLRRQAVYCRLHGAERSCLVARLVFSVASLCLHSVGWYLVDRYDHTRGDRPWFSDRGLARAGRQHQAMETLSLLQARLRPR
jgi:membrane protein insertase Oxa1/YidC/SpoIIIJ